MIVPPVTWSWIPADCGCAVQALDVEANRGLLSRQPRGLYLPPSHCQAHWQPLKKQLTATIKEMMKRREETDKSAGAKLNALQWKKGHAILPPGLTTELRPAACRALCKTISNR